MIVVVVVLVLAVKNISLYIHADIRTAYTAAAIRYGVFENPEV